MEAKKFSFSLGEDYEIEVALAVDAEELDVWELEEENLKAYLSQLRAHRDAMEDKEPKVRDHDAYLAWEEACDVLEDMIDDAQDRLDELED